ncbi:MAG: hypothetical protein Q7K65_03120 [Candidatus Buchananbacteria bacterium]|nr:hypothetical protein [Candidatus Buchananbacteria bacterium]
MADPVVKEELKNEPGKVHWFFKHTGDKIVNFARKHIMAFIIMVVLSLVSLFLLRVFFHHWAIELRKHFGLLIVGLPLLTLMWLLIRKGSIKKKIIVGLMYLILGSFVYFYGRGCYDYFSFYYRFKTLVTVELDELPITGHERIQPLNSIYSLAHEVMAESELPTRPGFVRIGDNYRWTMAVQPAYPLSQLLGEVDEIINVSGTSPSPDFSRDNRIKVSFLVGDNLRLSHNTNTAVIKRFGPWKFFNYEPSDIIYITDDNGEWVQVVSLIRWKGIFFPMPEFGGVVVIRQEKHSLVSLAKLIVGGTGEWIKPQDICNYNYLVGQDILSFNISRYMANSFRFQTGFFAPFPGYHLGDVRIPDLSEDVNQQPFTTHFKIGEVEDDNSLYHYFALEPYDINQQGLNTSLFIPADGSGPVYVYKHYNRNRSMIGVSAISAKVMESKKNYDWSRNFPVEHRPFIKKIDGQIRFFWLTTVVTLKQTEDNNKFIAGNIPELVITDASYNAPVWVDTLKPDGWESELKEKLSYIWSDQNR